MSREPAKRAKRMRRAAVVAFSIVAVAGVLAVLMLRSGGHRSQDQQVTEERAADVSDGRVGDVKTSGHRRMPRTVPEALQSWRTLQLASEDAEVPEFRDEASMKERQKRHLDNYRLFVAEAKLSVEQERALRRALGNATLTFALGFEYVKGPGSGVGIEEVMEAALDELRPGLETLSSAQRERFEYYFFKGDALLVAKLFDVDPIVEDLLPEKYSPTQFSATPAQ